MYLNIVCPLICYTLIVLNVTYKIWSLPFTSSCTTTELFKLLTSCLTVLENMLSSIVKRYMRDPVKTCFGLLKIQVKPF